MPGHAQPDGLGARIRWGVCLIVLSAFSVAPTFGRMRDASTIQ